jgi:hypothetical protein
MFCCALRELRVIVTREDVNLWQLLLIFANRDVNLFSEYYEPSRSLVFEEKLSIDEKWPGLRLSSSLELAC